MPLLATDPERAEAPSADGPSARSRPAAVGPDEFRAAMRRVPAAVTVVTTAVAGVRHGLTATAVASVSADPAQLLVCVNRDTRSAVAISMAGRFGVNYLGAEQITVAEAFAARTTDPEDRFRNVPVCDGGTGIPLLRDALVGMACTVVNEIHSGTHTIFIGQVTHLTAQRSAPLLYQDGAFTTPDGTQTTHEGTGR